MPSLRFHTSTFNRAVGTAKAVISIILLVFGVAVAASSPRQEANQDEDRAKKTDNLSSEERDFSIRPDDIPARLQEAKDKVDALFPSPLQRLHDLFDQGNDWLQRKAKLDLGFNYTVLYQHASQAQSSNDAAAGDLDFFGRWHLFDFDGRWAAALSFSTEWRHKFTTVSPSELGDNIGSLWGTTVGFNTQDYAMVELYWEQGSYDDGLTMRAGKVDPALIYDGGRYVSQNYAFLSPAFSDTPAMPLPASGLGTAAAVYLFEDFYVLGGVHDANAKKTQSGFNTIDRGEFFVALEFGVTPSYGKPGAGLYHATIWHSDKRKRADRPSGRGVALTLEQEFGAKGNVVPFLRYNFGDGGATAVRQTLAVGVGFEELFGQNYDIAGLGLAWGQPEDSSLRDQFTFETFYRFHLTPHTHLSPDIQAVINPSRTPEEDVVWVFSLRLRTLF